YPISQTTPPPTSGGTGLTTQWAYDFNSDGMNDYILGLPTSEVDPNGNSTSAQYDAFGRMIKLIRPGDATNSPTISIAYTNSSTFTTTLTQQIDPSTSYVFSRVYEGMGILTRIMSGGSIVDTVYQSPTVAKPSMRYFAGGIVYYPTTSMQPA